MRIHVVVGRKLGLDVRNRGETPEAQDETSAELRKVDFAVEHREVITVIEVMAEQLIARQTERGRVAVVLAVDRRKPKAPIDVICLHRVREALKINHGLIELISV